MPEEVLLDAVISSHDENTIETTKVWNVRIDQPVGESYNPGRVDQIGCRMETMNFFSGKRMGIHEKDNRFEAPNWTLI